MAENLSLRNLFKLVTGQETDIVRQRKNIRLGHFPTIIGKAENINQGQEDDQIWLEGTGLSFYKPQGGQDLILGDVVKYHVPLANPEKIQLPDAHSLKYIVQGTINSFYPSLSHFLDEDTKAEEELRADSSAIPVEGGTRVIRKPVKIIYAMAPPGDVNNATAGLTRMRVSENQVEYAIIIRLNPAGVQFNNQAELKRWIQTMYVHEMVHIRQKDILWNKLLHESLVNGKYPSQGKIFSTLDNPANTIANEAQAYWAGIRYAQMIQPSWFITDTSPNFIGLKKPFLKLKANGMDPLIEGEHTNHPVYHEKALEALWYNTVFFNIDYDGLVRWSKTDPELVSVIELCNRESLITDNEFETYLADVNTTQSKIYRLRTEIPHGPPVHYTVGGIATLGLVASLAGLIWLRTRNR